LHNVDPAGLAVADAERAPAPPLPGEHRAQERAEEACEQPPDLAPSRTRDMPAAVRGNVSATGGREPGLLTLLKQMTGNVNPP
jgi:hypothetical protein